MIFKKKNNEKQRKNCVIFTFKPTHNKNHDVEKRKVNRIDDMLRYLNVLCRLLFVFNSSLCTPVFIMLHLAERATHIFFRTVHIYPLYTQLFSYFTSSNMLHTPHVSLAGAELCWGLFNTAQRRGTIGRGSHDFINPARQKTKKTVFFLPFEFNLHRVCCAMRSVSRVVMRVPFSTFLNIAQE